MAAEVEIGSGESFGDSNCFIIIAQHIYQHRTRYKTLC